MISCDRDDGLWTVTLNRPDKANALTGAMLAELADIAEDAAGKARVLILTGVGKVFSAGADLDAAKAGLATDPVWERLSGALAALPCLTIAALNGTLAGGAFGMALACDLRVAVPGASFFYPVMRLGYAPQPSDPGRLAALLGPARARLILLAGARLDAAEALAIGLIDRVADDVMAEAHVLATPALGASSEHVARLKRMT
ncbi:MAG: enoyl-CoA hydratase/isomerase family protein [Limimaricola sp.]|uniref:enoyl-CoA hydratase/isomerase family protein n=1 Tax=Limimaricola sp. TaxID=2211665 RepID=UPI001E16683E|nr:enoyl-CoA hydratase/isomerase family protein [Limimaricola sp.]MBI1417015.1 enoyl-CoA hydratase/isomerase family protein [Limimaricola sp.]